MVPPRPEAAINSTIFPLWDLAATTVPVGRVTARNWLYVVDRYGRPQPAGVPGELREAFVQADGNQLRAPRPGQAECAGSVAKLMTRHRVAIDRDETCNWINTCGRDQLGQILSKRHLR
ncbi:MAG: hypothetical protein GY856_18915 [bacterium]|nr:hypothetical protein [bacterium]